MAKNLPAMRNTWVWSLGWEDALEEGMAATSVFLPGESHEQRSLAGYSPQGHKESDMTKWLTFLKIILLNFIFTSLSHFFLGLFLVILQIYVFVELIFL